MHAQRSVEGLRRDLRPLLKSRRARWIALSGLGADDARAHSALHTSLRCVGFYGETGEQRPDLVVLDWSAVADCSADGFAMLPVLAFALRERGVATVICGPSDAGIARLIDEMNLRAICGGDDWVTNPTLGSPGARALAEAAAFASTGDRPDLDRFLDQVGAALPTLGGRADEVDLVYALLAEAVQNVRSHSGARRAVVTALLRPRLRPPVLQFGLADDGVGVSANVLTQDRYAWLQQFTDASVTETVIHQQLSGRANGAGGGGFGAMLQEALRATASNVVLRTGAAHLAFPGGDAARYRKTSLTYGVGTQLKIELRLRSV
jgi:hypothetical protein